VDAVSEAFVVEAPFVESLFEALFAVVFAAAL